MRRTARRLAVLVAALVTGCSPEAPSPPSDDPNLVDVVVRPASARGRVGKAIKKKKEPGPGGGVPKSSSLELKSDL
jgi:hypothetical protein